jgi:hypothetical protein
MTGLATKAGQFAKKRDTIQKLIKPTAQTKQRHPYSSD